MSGPLLPLQTARYLMASGWLHLAGNHERQVLTQGPGQWRAADAHAHANWARAELAWMATLRPSLAWRDDIHLCHASPRSDLEYLLDTVEPGGVRLASASEVHERLAGVGAALVLCGHSHHPRIVRSADGQLIVNPGSVGLPAYDDDTRTGMSSRTARPMRAMRSSNRLAASGRRAAGRALRPRIDGPAGRAARPPDWAHALRTGYMPRAASAG